MRLPYFVWGGILTGAIGLLGGCTNQARAYNHNPMCRQAEQTCKAYYKTLEQTKPAQGGAGLELMREDCEASQRACAEGVRTTEDSPTPRAMRRW